MKKIVLSGIILSAAILLASCGSAKKDSTEGSVSAKSDKATISVKSGNYVLEEGKTVGEDEGYLALELSIKNNGKESMSVSSEDFTLYDENDNKIPGENIYSDDDTFKSFSGDNLSGGKNLNGYAVFKVDKEKKYELHYSPILFDSESESKDIELQIDTADYTDHTKNIETAVDSYISQVFLNKKKESANEKQKKEEETSSDLTNDLVKEHNDFNQKFAEEVTSMFEYYKPSSEECNKLVTEIEAANQKKAKLTYKVCSMFPNQVVLFIKPETINLDDVDLTSVEDKFISENEGKYSEDDYDKVYQDAEKFFLQQLPTKLNVTPISTSDMMDSGDGFKIKLTKNKDKWQIDSSDSSGNSEYQYLVRSFMGELDS
ncbi:hypothetical protein IGI37_001100 [Enterococcus sp. AZ194]|uniref:DUF4352 domain-containing protein n=1 Tax=Enterococcus sp. AZ194 TaxID=2774629 RepID=UPI003F25CEA8